MKKIIIGVVIVLITAIVVIFAINYYPLRSVAVGGTTNVSDLSSNTLTIGTGCDNSFTCTPGMTVDANGKVILDGGILYSYTLSTTTGTAVTLKQSDILNYSTILATPIVGATTWTFPASSTLSSFVPLAGDTRIITIVNSTSTAAATLTLAAGTGSSIKLATTTAVINAGSVAQLSCTRKTATTAAFDIVCLFLNGI